MTVADPHCRSHSLDDETARRLISRLESRAQDAVFTRLFDRYADTLEFSDDSLTLEVGCGTGAMIRSLVGKPNFRGRLVGVDQSPAFIDAASGFADDAGIADRVEFRVGDAHDLGSEDGEFDLVIAHTVISHVVDPQAVANECARVLRPGGLLVVFDGDYSSLTYGFPDDPELGRRMDRALAETTFQNPLIMRDLIKLLPESGFDIEDTLVEVVSEIGEASYFKSFANTYAPMVASGDLMGDGEVERWVNGQTELMANRQFFASCNYYTYRARRV